MKAMPAEESAVSVPLTYVFLVPTSGVNLTLCRYPYMCLECKI